MQRQPLTRVITFPSLPVHAWLNQLGFPRSYTGKFYLVAFFANALPLAAVALAMVLFPDSLSERDTFLMVLASTVLGGLFASMALAGLLHPIHEAHQTLKSYLDGGEVPSLPLTSPAVEDEGGALARNLNYAVAMFATHQNLSQRESPRDFLTGLFNRYAAEGRLVQLARMVQVTPFDVSIALLELSNLKEIRERCGYAVGDQVLRQVARTVAQQLRNTDWVARWNSEELLVAIQANTEGAAHAIQRIAQEIETMSLEIGGVVVTVTVDWRHTLIRGGEPLTELIERLEQGKIRVLSD